MLLKDKRIFVVEDHVQNRVVFHIALVKYGAVVDYERWGRSAAQRLKHSQPFDLIILDLMLAEEVSGFDVYDEIRELPNYATVPIVAVSAMDPALALPKTRAKGFAGFIAKPIDSQVFAKQIADILQGQQVWVRGR